MNKNWRVMYTHWLNNQVQSGEPISKFSEHERSAIMPRH